MRKILLPFLLLPLAVLSLSAQSLSLRPEEYLGEYSQYEGNIPSPTRPPKGFKPFYISHIGRHGSRFAVGTEIYEEMRAVLSDAARDGKLTPEGERLREKYEAFYPYVAYRGGDLTRKGQEQHRMIAQRMVRDYPEVFRGKTSATVRSTPVPRVILSMFAFLDRMKEMDPDIRYDADAGYVHVTVLDPMDETNPAYVPNKPMSPEAKASHAAYFHAMVDLDGLTDRFFTDREYLERRYGRWHFFEYLKKIVIDIPSLDEVPPEAMTGVFSDRELQNLYRHRNYYLYLKYGPSPLTDRKYMYETWSTLEDLILSAERDIAEGTALNLRFSHDSCLLPLFSLMGLNGFGIVTTDPEEANANWKGYDVPMAANLQLVFYRNRRGEILVKPMLNGHDATLPFPPADGPFYRWTDFKAFYLPVIAESKRFMAQYAE